MAKKKVLIIGGGMAGLVCAIQLAKEGNKVTLFERNQRIGKKLLVTGNGRCNLTNKNVAKVHYHSQSVNIFDNIYEQFDYIQTLQWLEEIGIDTVELDEGKIYPMSLQAKSVVMALLLEAEHVGIDIVYEARIQKIDLDNKFKIIVQDKTYYGTQLVIATGGKSYSDSGSSGDGYQMAKSFGHSIVETYPSIVQLQTNDPYAKMLKGLKYFVKATLVMDKETVLRVERDEVLFTEYGLSGPVILQLSTMAEPHLSKGRGLEVILDFMPNLSEEDLDVTLRDRLHRFSYRGVQDALNGFINQRLMIPLLKRSGIELEKKAGDVSKVERQNLVQSIKQYKEKVTDTYLWNQAQVTKGGVHCGEVHPETLESKLLQNLYFAGEVLDIDGDCGGYNLQWAISSGATVAKHIQEK